MKQEDAASRSRVTGSKCEAHNEGKGLDICLENKVCQWAIPVLNLKYCANLASTRSKLMKQRFSE